MGGGSRSLQVPVLVKFRCYVDVIKEHKTRVPHQWLCDEVTLTPKIHVIYDHVVDMEANDLEKNDNFNVCGQKYLNRGSWRETNHDLRK